MPEGGLNKNDVGTPAHSRRGDHLEKHYNPNAATSRKHIDRNSALVKDYTTFYMPNG